MGLCSGDHGMIIIIARYIGQIIIQVLFKLILTMCSKEVIGRIMFACLHRLVKLTCTKKDDQLVDKLERMYWGISDTTDQQAEELLRKIKKDE